MPSTAQAVIGWRAERHALVSARLPDALLEQAPARRQLELQLNALAEINDEDPRMARVITLGWLAELGTFETPFPIFESFRDSIRLGQESGEFLASLSADTVAETLCACYNDTLHRWLFARQHDGKPFPLAPALQAKLSLVLDGLVPPQAEERL